MDFSLAAEAVGNLAINFIPNSDFGLDGNINTSTFIHSLMDLRCQTLYMIWLTSALWNHYMKLNAQKLTRKKSKNRVLKQRIEIKEKSDGTWQLIDFKVEYLYAAEG